MSKVHRWPRCTVPWKTLCVICGQSMQTSTCAGLRAHRTPGAGDATRQQGSPLGLGTEEAGRGSPPARHKSECCHGHITLLQGKHHKAFLKIHILKKKKKSTFLPTEHLAASGSLHTPIWASGGHADPREEGSAIHASHNTPLEPLGTSHKDWGTQPASLSSDHPGWLCEGGNTNSGTVESQGDVGLARGRSRLWGGGKWGPEGSSPNLFQRCWESFITISAPAASPGLCFHLQPLRSGLMAPTMSGSSQSIACPTLGVHST